MELGFTVKYGPLSQISVPLFGIENAVQLATGAHGWWKGRSRNQSLAHILESRKVSLVSASTFHPKSYLERRQGGCVRGTALQHGKIISLALPHASTARDEGHMCLRALVASLLCFFEPAAVTHVLADVIPSSLFHYELDGEDISIEGPILTAMRQYVDAVMTEEDSDTLRQSLLDNVSTRSRRFTEQADPALLDRVLHDSLFLVETPLVTGLVRWVLTSPHKREHSWYPTRSLTVWALSVVMAELGFEISASSYPLSTVDEYEMQRSAVNFGSHPSVMLVTASVGDTDLSAEFTNFATEWNRKPQCMPIQAVPLFLFQHLPQLTTGGNWMSLNLSDVWNHTFRHVTNRTSSLQWSRDNHGLHLGVAPLDEDGAVVLEEHKNLLNIWSPSLGVVLGKIMRDYILHDVSADEVVAFVERIRNGEHTEEFGVEKSRPSAQWHIMVTILLATTFAIASKGLRVDDQIATASAQIAFSPDILYTPKVDDLIHMAGLAIGQRISYADWTAFLLMIACGKPLPSQDLNASGQFGQKIGSQRVVSLFGMQANGISVLSHFLVKPSVNRDSLLSFHLQKGQLLNLPLDENGYIRAGTKTLAVETLILDPDPQLTELTARDSFNDGQIDIRIDVEPHWEVDAQTVALRVRVDGLRVAVFSPLIVVSRILQDGFQVDCSCEEPSHATAVEVRERWQEVSIRTILKGRGARFGLEKGDRAVIYVGSDNEAAALLCAGKIHCDRMMLTRDCMKCIREALRPTAIKKDQTIVLLAAIPERPPATNVDPEM